MKQTVSNIIESVKNIFNSIIADKMFLFLFAVILIIFIVITFYTYNKYIKPSINMNHLLNKEFTNSNNNENDVLVILFKTEWCPYCKKAMPAWHKFEQYVNDINNTNDYKVKLSVIDCDEKPDIAEKYNVEGYPTIKLIYKGKIYDYDAKPDKQHLIQFLESSIN